MTNTDWIFVLIAIVVYAVKFQFRAHLAEASGFIIYGSALIFGRILWGVGRLGVAAFRKPKEVVQAIIPEQLPEPTSILDWPAYYKLRPGQVVFLNGRKKPIIINLADGHSLLAGITGGGKTVAIHAMLLQLYALGERFWGNFEVYLLDLKGHRQDALYRWRPLVDGFASIDQPEQLKALLDLLSERTHVESNKQVLVFIDEVANLTAFADDKKAASVLKKLATQFRTSGNLIMATQVTRFDVIDTIIRHNMGRRICFTVRELPHIRAAMAMRSLKEKDIPKRKGEFLLLDAGSQQLQRGRVEMPVLYDTPRQESDITRLIQRSLVAQAEDDPRLKLFVAVCQDKKRGGQLPGIVKVAAEIDWLQQKDIMFFYRNYHLAGAIKKGLGKNKNANYLVADFEEAYSMVRRYISLRQWHDEPPKEGEDDES